MAAQSRQPGAVLPAPTATKRFIPEDTGAANTAYIDWVYVSCTTTPGNAAASGSCNVVVPSFVAPGTYQLRLLANNGYTSLATSNAFTVHPEDPLADLVEGVQQLVSPGSPGPVYGESTAWTAIVQGDADASFPSTFVAARELAPAGC